MIVVDGSNQIFGRMSTHIAKKLIQGEEVHLINAEKIIIRGDPAMIANDYLTKRKLQHKGTPERSPVWPKVPHYLVKKMIKGMLPKENRRGKEALRRLRVYTGNPKKLEGAIDFENARFDGSTRHITILRICKLIGHQEG